MYGAVAGFANPMTTAGDLIEGGVAGAAARLGIGSNAQALVVSAGALAWGNAAVSWPLTNSDHEGFQPNSIANNALDLKNAASAVNGITITGTATGTPPTLAATGGDSTIGLNLVFKGAAPLQINGAAGSAAQVLTSQGASAAPTWSSIPGPSFPLTNASDETFQPNAIANNALTAHNAASAVNGVTITGTATGTPASIAATGGDSTIGLNLVFKGAAPLQINGAAGSTGQFLTSQGASAAPIWSTATVSWPLTNSGDEGFQPNSISNSALTVHNAASAVNGVTITGTATGTPASIAATGGDSTIGLNLVFKGAAPLQLNGAAGTLGQVLTSQGAAAAPIWSTVGGGGITWPLTNSGDQGFEPTNIANIALNLHNNASAVNGIQITGTATGVAAVLTTAGSDSAVSLSITCQGTGTVTITPATTVTGRVTANGGVNVVNSLQMNGANGTAGQYLQTQGNATPSWVSDTVGAGVVYSADPRIAGGYGTPLSPFGAGSAKYSRIMHGGASCAHIGLDVGTSSGNISVGFYANSGTQDSAVPAALVNSSGAIACPSSGFASVAVTSTAIIQGQHWIAISCDNTSATVSRVFGNVSGLGAGLSKTQSSGGHPLPNPAGTITNTAVSFDLVGIA